MPSFEWRRAANQKTFQGDDDGRIDVSTFDFDYKTMALTGRGYSAITPPFMELFERTGDRIVHAPVETSDYSIQPAGDGIRLDLNGGIYCDQHPEVTKCLEFSYWTSSIYFYIDLVGSGIDAWVLDNVRPRIRVSQMVNHRHDCSAELEFIAQLMMQRRRGEYGHYGDYHDRANVNTNKDKSMRKSWNQWTPTPWEKWILEFDDYPSGMRHLIVRNSGNDDKGWAGHYGPKIANLKVEVILPDTPRVR